MKCAVGYSPDVSTDTRTSESRRQLDGAARRARRVARVAGLVRVVADEHGAAGGPGELATSLREARGVGAAVLVALEALPECVRADGRPRARGRVEDRRECVQVRAEPARLALGDLVDVALEGGAPVCVADLQGGDHVANRGRAPRARSRHRGGGPSPVRRRRRCTARPGRPGCRVPGRGPSGVARCCGSSSRSRRTARGRAARSSLKAEPHPAEHARDNKAERQPRLERVLLAPRDEDDVLGPEGPVDGEVRGPLCLAEQGRPRRPRVPRDPPARTIPALRRPVAPASASVALARGLDRFAGLAVTGSPAARRATARRQARSKSSSWASSDSAFAGTRDRSTSATRSSRRYVFVRPDLNVGRPARSAAMRTRSSIASCSRALPTSHVFRGRPRSRAAGLDRRASPRCARPARRGVRRGRAPSWRGPPSGARSDPIDHALDHRRVASQCRGGFAIVDGVAGRPRRRFHKVARVTPAACARAAMLGAGLPSEVS